MIHWWQIRMTSWMCLSHSHKLLLYEFNFILVRILSQSQYEVCVMCFFCLNVSSSLAVSRSSRQVSIRFPFCCSVIKGATNFDTARSIFNFFGVEIPNLFCKSPTVKTRFLSTRSLTFWTCHQMRSRVFPVKVWEQIWYPATTRLKRSTRRSSHMG